MEYNKLKHQYSEFIYKDYEIEKHGNKLSITYNFEISNLITFNPTWEFVVSKDYDEEVLNLLVFNLGMVELVSYWKCVCSEKVIIKAGNLTFNQAKWWKKLYFNGLGEFFFVNKITTNYNDFMDLQVNNQKGSKLIISNDYHGTLVPIGGGKDSNVSLELLKSLGEDITTFSINRTAAISNVIAISEVEKDILITRNLDKKLFNLNKEGYLNGHTPFSAIVAFSSYLSAYLNGIRFISLSNESSANEATVLNSNVNHQYSKSFEFENDFNNYMQDILISPIHYFSLLRGMNEIQIAAHFAKYKQYHQSFRSCNVGSKTGVWCNNCPKCLFVYIILSPFLTNEELNNIFHEDLLAKLSLEKYFRELIGIDENKPFECVGTRKEVLAALGNLVKNKRLSSLVLKYQDYILNHYVEIDDLLNHYNSDNLIPERFLKIYELDR